MGRCLELFFHCESPPCNLFRGPRMSNSREWRAWFPPEKKARRDRLSSSRVTCCAFSPLF